MNQYTNKQLSVGMNKFFFLIWIFILCVFPGLFLQAQGTTWKHVYHNGAEGLAFRSVTSNSTRFVAIGDGRICYTSSDGLQWNAEKTVPTTYFGIVYGNGKFIAAGYKGSLITSTDGINWTSKTTGVTSNFRGIVYDPERKWFLAVAEEGQFAVSKDGGNTFTKSVTSGPGFNGVAFGNGMFVGVGGNGTIFYSSDAATWTSKTISTTHNMCCAYGNNTFVVGGKYYLNSSSDGINWTLRKTVNTAYFLGAAYTNLDSGNIFIFMGEPQNTSDIPMYTSTDGISWTKVNSNSRAWLMAAGSKASSNRVVAMGVWGSVVQSDNSPSRVTVTNPDFLGGKSQMSFKAGSTMNITWTITGSVNNLDLEYSTKGLGGPFTTIAQNVTASAGSYSWIVPDTVSTDCVIRIGDADDEPLTHSAPFTITDVNQATITVLKPNGGETLTAGSTYNITWKGSTAFTSVDIEYNDGSKWNVIIDGAKDTGSYAWVVPNISTTKAKIWMKGYSASGDPADFSDNTFTITGGGVIPTITITAPNGGETLVGGTAYNIRWQGSVTFNSVDLEYFNGTNWLEIKYGTEDDGTYEWTVPNISTTQAKIWIKGWSSSGDNPADRSDNPFTIIPAPSGKITVTSPNGGEAWVKNSTQNITWTSSGEVGDVKISYSTNGGINWTTLVSSTSNDGTYSWPLPNITANDCLVKIVDVTNALISDVSDKSFSVGGPPQIVLSKTRYNFGGLKESPAPPTQTLFISNGGAGEMNWTATADVPWIVLNPSSGSGGGIITIAINQTGLALGKYSGTITISAEGVNNSPQTAVVNLNVINPPDEQPPFGFFSAPLDGTAGVYGAIPVTGWALDDIGVVSVKLYRILDGNLSFIGDAAFVEGARPDVETAYPDYPKYTAAGWGYMLLTNFLPDGVTTLKVIITDTTGHGVDLGTKTITIDNAHSSKPFGTIDTPEQGGSTFVSPYRNNGWALTPQPSKIPENGSTLNVYIDGVFIGKAKYNLYRSDIATLFPGYKNSNMAGGYLDIDMTAYSNGVHAINWSVIDDAGNSEGLGARYFLVQNVGGTARSTKSTGSATSIPEGQPAFIPTKNFDLPVEIPNFKPIMAKKGYNQDERPWEIYPDEAGIIHYEVNELDRVQIHLDKGINKGYQVVENELRLLPVGSTLDLKKGIFYWQLGTGFLGDYEMLFIGNRETGEPFTRRIHLKINPKSFE